jgi:hypothetical protein
MQLRAKFCPRYSWVRSYLPRHRHATTTRARGRFELQRSPIAAAFLPARKRRSVEADGHKVCILCAGGFFAAFGERL